MAISKHRKVHNKKVRDIFQDLVEQRLSIGLNRNGKSKKVKAAIKPIHNPDRLKATKSERRQMKSQKRLERLENE